MDEKRNLSSLADRKDDALDLSLGFIAFITQWETENTEISLLMASNNYRIGTIITYNSKKISVGVDTEGL